MQGAGRTEQGTLQHTQREATAGRVHGHGQQGGEIFARKHLSVHLIVDPQARSAPSFVSFALWSVFFCTALPIIVWVTARGLEHATLEGCIHNMSLVCSCSARPHISCEASLAGCPACTLLCRNKVTPLIACNAIPPNYPSKQP